MIVLILGGDLDEIYDSGCDVLSLDQSSTYEFYLEDKNMTASDDKQKVLLADCCGVVQGFDITFPPNAKQNQTFFPTIKIMKHELLRCDPHIKMIRGKKQTKLVALFSGEKYKVTDEMDIIFIT